MTDNPAIKAGLAGSGFAASFHADGVRKVSGVNVELAGVYSPTQEHREKFAEERGIPAFDSMEELLENVDVVHVCAPPVAHESIAVSALEQDKSAIVEKPLTGYFGNGSEDFDGDTFPKKEALDSAVSSVKRMRDAEAESQGRIMYAENWVYAPAIQKERKILEKTGAQILWLHGEESHHGSHSPDYGSWKTAGGGVMLNKGCHPLTGALYLKRVEGWARDGKPIRPVKVSARAHALTRMQNFRDEGHIRCDYDDIDDFSIMHVVFDDGTLADIFASDIIMGGIHDWIQVATNNHRTICNINPNDAMKTYNPVESNFEDVYTVEKAGTKQGWSFTSPDEDWFLGYQQEIQAFYENVAEGTAPHSDLSLAGDCMATIYNAYVSAENDGAEEEIEHPW
jgi:predicted dehydrogenase